MIRGEVMAIRLIIEEGADIDTAESLKEKFTSDENAELVLKLNETGLSLISGENELRGDFEAKKPRLRQNNLNCELVVKAAKIKGKNKVTVIDATAGMGEDSLLLAAAGCEVKLFERNPIVFELLADAMRRAEKDDELKSIVERMHAFNCDSIEAMKNCDEIVDVVLLDPMFPERQKSALVKKKLQVIQKIESPCSDEKELFLAAVGVKPKKLVIKRPPKGEFLAGVKPDYSLTGKAVRFDCFTEPFLRLEKLKEGMK